MINFIKTYFKEKSESNQDQVRKENANAKILATQKRIAFIKETKALRLITINNASYIRASINVLNGTVNHASGSSIAETRQKRAILRKRLEWLKVKKEEEEAMILYYNSILEKV
jgi:hypothetical protein